MKFSNIHKHFLIYMLAFCLPLNSLIQAQNDCQNHLIEGKYHLINDSDGKSPKKDATIILTLSGKSAHLIAKMPTEIVESDGKYFACNNQITITFDEFDINAYDKPFSLDGNNLELPFLALGGKGEGSSSWLKIDNISVDNELLGLNNNNSNDLLNNLQEEKLENANQNQIDNQDNNINNPKQNKENDPNKNTDKGKNQNQDLNRGQNNDSGQHGQENNYAGVYYGTGRGWEVRFKQTSGDFVSQFSGVKKDELPFQNDKIIMSLLVEHATSFKINIDENGEVTGDGEIVYNVVPNLCGLAILTEQVNSAVNLMGEFAFFLDMSAKIGQATVARFEGMFLGMEGQLAKTMKNVAEQGLSLTYEYLGTKLPEKMKALDLEAQQGTALCNCAAGQASIKGGNAVGPATIKEMVSTFGVDVAKALFMDMATGNLPVGLILSIPGVTQIQYYYKGLQNGPETRKFNIKGKLVNGELFLNMDGDVYEGSKLLTIEYMVNYKKETPTFPTWSPFLSKGAIMQPAGSTVTIYEQVIKTRSETYKDAATGETKTIEIPYTETKESREILPFPFASFREAGKQRNGVKVWHEYEYNWSVYKASEE